MKNIFLLFLLATAYCLLPTAAAAQTVTGKAEIKWVSSLPSTCVPTRKDRVLVYKYTATTGLYYCSAANVWTAVGTSTVSYPLLASDGSAAAPAYSYSSDTDTGQYRSGANTLNWATGGTLRATLSSAGLFTTTGGVTTTTATATTSFTGTQGTLTTSVPAFNHTATWNGAGVTFTNLTSDVTDTASAAASKLIDLKVGGTTKFNVTKAGAGTFAAGVSGTTGTFSGVVDGSNGSAAAPAFTFTSDPDTGVFRSGANALGFATGGTERGTLSSAGLFTTTGGLASTTGAFSSTITSTQGTLAGASTPAFTHTATWNNGATTFRNIFSNVTNTASDWTSTLIDLQVGGGSKFVVFASGKTIINPESVASINAGYDAASAVKIGDWGGAVNGTVLVVDDSAQTVDISATVGTTVTGPFTVSGSGTVTGDLNLNTAGTAIYVDKTITAGGTTGAQTINKIAGTVNFAAGASSIVVTNAEADASSLVFTTIRTADATCTHVKSTAMGVGSFSIVLNATCTAETSVGFFLVK